MLESRPNPYLYVTWLAEHMTGTLMCDFKLWFKANYKNWAQPPNDFDTASWMMAHTRLLREMIAQVPEGRTLYIEDQGSFWATYNGVTISGKPDLVLVHEDSQTVIVQDAKTGKPSPKHEAQLQLYMWFLPTKFPELRRYRFSGELVYSNHPNKSVPYPERKLFVSALDAATTVASAVKAPRKLPSEQECGWCNITREDCDERIETE